MKISQRELILAPLITGGRLTPARALWLFGCFRLAARICELRRRGHDIKTDMIEVASIHRGIVTVAQYSLENVFRRTS